ncbi:hypothetical protein JB92DRAFT_781516 [Gautieria morchelliformis]|nr:hypothetical protein JB92DRAFT_781516 [Gautieria morchelliformis]
MTIILGPDDPKSVPPSSPPTYAEVAASRPRPAERAAQPINSGAATPSYAAQNPQPQPGRQQAYEPMPGPPPQRVYGPTPLAASHAETGTVLPYYDPRSPWAMQSATSRARRRFFAALFWGCVIWLAVGSLVGGVVDDAGRRRGGGSWAVE